MALPYRVLDINKCRDREAVQGILAAGDSILIIDEFLSETMKGDQWAYIYQQNTAHLVGLPGVYGAEPINQLMIREADSHRACGETELISERYTAMLRQLLLNPSAYLDPAVVEEGRRSVLSHTFRDEKGESIRNICAAIEKAFKEHGFLAEIRNREILGNDLLEFSRGLARLTGAGTLTREGWSQEEADAFMRHDSVLYRFELATVLKCLRWAIESGYQCARVALLVNESTDLDYIVTASYCQGLVTADARSIQLHSDLGEALRLA